VAHFYRHNRHVGVEEVTALQQFDQCERDADTGAAVLERAGGALKNRNIAAGAFKLYRRGAAGDGTANDADAQPAIGAPV
jgi:hypothetical protein